MLEGKNTKHALSLTFTPLDRVHKLAFKLRDKIKGKEGTPISFSTIAAIQRQEVTKEASSATTGAKQEISVQCSYCNRFGDELKRCFLPKKELKQCGGSASSSKQSASGCKPAVAESA